MGGGPGMMWASGYANGPGWGLWMVLAGLSMAAFWGAVVVGVVLLARSLSGRSARTEDSALDILRRRHAAGEITREQFETMRADLERSESVRRLARRHALPTSSGCEGTPGGEARTAMGRCPSLPLYMSKTWHECRERPRQDRSPRPHASICMWPESRCPTSALSSHPKLPYRPGRRTRRPVTATPVRPCSFLSKSSARPRRGLRLHPYYRLSLDSDGCKLGDGPTRQFS